MLKAKELKEKITKEFGEKIINDGFSYNKANNEFKCGNGNFIYFFSIEQVAWSHSYSIDVHLYVSQKQIELILEKIVGKRRHKMTLGQTVERIYKSPDGRKIINGNLTIWIRQDEDIEAAIESLGWYYMDIAKPYFEKYQTLQSIDHIINNPPFNHCPADVGGSFDNRCMKGLIVARLVNNPNYQKLLDIYDEAIKETMSTESIENYYKVREYLMYNKI